MYTSVSGWKLRAARAGAAGRALPWGVSRTGRSGLVQGPKTTACFRPSLAGRCLSHSLLLTLSPLCPPTHEQTSNPQKTSLCPWVLCCGLPHVPLLFVEGARAAFESSLEGSAEKLGGCRRLRRAALWARGCSGGGSRRSEEQRGWGAEVSQAGSADPALALLHSDFFFHEYI